MPQPDAGPQRLAAESPRRVLSIAVTFYHSFGEFTTCLEGLFWKERFPIPVRYAILIPIPKQGG
jgi:hypothetical protein